jgi:hypothetical protein
MAKVNIQMSSCDTHKYVKGYKTCPVCAAINKWTSRALAVNQYAMVALTLEGTVYRKENTILRLRCGQNRHSTMCAGHQNEIKELNLKLDRTHKGSSRWDREVRPCPPAVLTARWNEYNHSLHHIYRKCNQVVKCDRLFYAIASQACAVCDCENNHIVQDRWKDLIAVRRVLETIFGERFDDPSPLAAYSAKLNIGALHTSYNTTDNLDNLDWIGVCRRFGGTKMIIEITAAENTTSKICERICASLNASGMLAHKLDQAAVKFELAAVNIRWGLGSHEGRPKPEWGRLIAEHPTISYGWSTVTTHTRVENAWVDTAKPTDEPADSGDEKSVRLAYTEAAAQLHHEFVELTEKKPNVDRHD